MRDLQHWKDKVELTLDGRQVFFLFFGGAVLACLLFAVGVMTGRRLEARAIALDTPTADDPLAALDQLGDLEDEELTYHRALTRPHGDNDRLHPAAKAPTPAKPVAKPPAVKSLPSHASADAEPSRAPVVLPAVAPKKIADSPVKLVADESKTVTAALTKADGKDGVAEAGAPHFTLQLSAFAAKKDADDFMHRVQAAGYRAFVVASDLPGKGLLYRVRVGDYGSRDAALAEKSNVEKKLKVAAYLAKL
jgi:cell division septation protein DedD